MIHHLHEQILLKTEPHGEQIPRLQLSNEIILGKHTHISVVLFISLDIQE